MRDLVVLLAVVAALTGATLMAAMGHGKTATPDLIVDRCALEEYRNECEMTMSDDRGTPQELQACFEKAKQEALRIRAGVPASCRGV